MLKKVIWSARGILLLVADVIKARVKSANVQINYLSATQTLRQKANGICVPLPLQLSGKRGKCIKIQVKLGLKSIYDIINQLVLWKLIESFCAQGLRGVYISSKFILLTCRTTFINFPMWHSSQMSGLLSRRTLRMPWIRIAVSALMPYNWFRDKSKNWRRKKSRKNV